MIKLNISHLASFIAVALLLTWSPSAFAVDPDHSAPAASAGQSAEDNSALRAQAAIYAKAFADGNAQTIANMWTEDGSYVQPDGTELRGRAAIESFFNAFFKKFGGQVLELNIESIKFPADSIAVEEGTTGLAKAGVVTNRCRYTVVHVKKDGNWRMLAVSETSCAPLSATSDLQDLSWLIGDWTARGTSTVHFKAAWAANHKFIRCEFSSDKPASAEGEDLQIIGWSPMERRIACWHFSARGGVGFGTWIKNGQTWLELARGMQPDGTICSAHYLLKKLDNDSFQWQSTDRKFGGLRVPDTQLLTVTRDK